MLVFGRIDGPVLQSTTDEVSVQLALSSVRVISYKVVLNFASR